MKERIITHPPGQAHQPRRICPACGASVRKALKYGIGVAYVCDGRITHRGQWDDAAVVIDEAATRRTP